MRAVARFAALAVGWAVLFLAPVGPVNAAWLQDGVDAARTGVSLDAGPAWNDVAWTIQLRGGAVERSPPVILDASAYVVTMELAELQPGPGPMAEARSYRTLLSRVDLSTASIAWVVETAARHYHRTDAGDLLSPSVVSDGDHLYLVHFDGVTKYDLDGSALWHAPHRSSLPVPVHARDCVEPAIAESLLYYVCAEQGEDSATEQGSVGARFLAALETTRGESKWFTPLDSAQPLLDLDDATSPLSPSYDTVRGLAVVDSHVLVVGMFRRATSPAFHPAILAFHRVDGTYAWSASDASDVEPETVTGASVDGSDVETGNAVSLPTGSDGRVLYRHNRLLILSESTGGVLENLTIREGPLQGDHGTGMVLLGGSAFVSGHDRILRFDTNDWTSKSIFSLAGLGEHFAYGPLVLASGILYARSVVETRPADAQRALLDVPVLMESTIYAIDVDTEATLWKHVVGPTSPVPTNYRPYSFSVADGLVVVAGFDGTVTVLGRTAASLHPSVQVSSRHPALGENVTLDLSATGPGIFGPATAFRADWGDGESTDWQADPVFSHRYSTIADMRARFFVRNEANQTASEPVTFYVAAIPGGSSALNALQRAFTAENMPTTLGMLGAAVFLTGGLAFLVSRRAVPSASVETPRYVVERELGRGASSRAMLARDTVLDRHVVLKQPLGAWLVDASSRRAFLREARLLARLRHPNVVVLYEVITDDEAPVLVLEYAEGGSLAHALRELGRMPRSDAVAIVLAALEGLAYLHAQGVLHGDLKPSNILLDARNIPKITDFGIAQARRMDDRDVTRDPSRDPAGTIAYMSPERLRGAPMDQRSDVFAMGAVAFEVLTGNVYHDGTDQGERTLIRRSAPRGLSRPMERFLRMALAADPARRFANAGEMLDAFQDIVPPQVRRAPVTAEAEAP